MVQAALVVLLLQGLVVVRGLGAAVVGLVVVRVHRRLRHLAVGRTAALLFGAASTAAEEGLVEMAVQVLRCLALELGFRVLVRAQAKARSGCSLCRHHHVLVDAHAADAVACGLMLPLETRSRQIVHLRDAVVVIVVRLRRCHSCEPATTGITVIRMPLRRLLRALRHEVVQQDLLVLQDLSLQVLDGAVVSLLLGRLLAANFLLLSA